MIHAAITIAGVETMHMLRKGQVPWVFMKSQAQCARNFIHRLFDLPGHLFLLILIENQLFNDDS